LIAKSFQELPGFLEIPHNEFDFLTAENSQILRARTFKGKARLRVAPEAQDLSLGAETAIGEVETDIHLQNTRLDETRLQLAQAPLQSSQIPDVELRFRLLAVG
jgi:hypothetical protein